MDTIKATRELEDRLNLTVKDIKRQKIVSIIFFTLSGLFLSAIIFFMIAYFINLGSGREHIFGIFSLILFSVLIVTLGIAILELIIIRSLKQKVVIIENAILDIKEKRPWRSEPINPLNEEEIEVEEINDVMKK